MSKAQDIILESELCHDGFFKLKRHTIQYEKFDGSLSRVHKREILCQSPAVAILLFDPERENILLTEQVRIGAVENNNAPRVLEIPAGLIEPGESVNTAAEREILEETGYQCNSFEVIGEFYTSPGGTDEINTVLYSTCNLDSKGVHGASGENEDIKTHILPLNEAEELIKQTKVSATTAFALMWLKSKLMSEA